MLNWPFPISPLRQFDGECDEWDEAFEDDILEDYIERMKRISVMTVANYQSI